MARVAMTAAAGVRTLAAIALVGCWIDNQSGASRQGSLQHGAVTAQRIAGDEGTQHTYVKCRGTLAVYEQDHPWFEDSSAGHDDGRAPLASFVLTEPLAYADRTLDILFKDAAANAISPPAKADIGRSFTFEIPEEFLTGKHTSIDNATVRHLQRIEP